MNTSSAAARALSVSTPSDGPQSMSTKSNGSVSCGHRLAEDHLAADDAGQFHLGGGEVDVRRERPTGSRSTARRTSASGLFDDEHVVERRDGAVRLDAEVRAGVGLRVEVEDADALARRAARAAARLTVVVVLPTPPFWLMTAIRRMVRASDRAAVLPRSESAL